MGEAGIDLSERQEQAGVQFGSRLWYFAQAHCHFPSTFANNVQVMKACTGFALAGQAATLVFPWRLNTSRRLKTVDPDLWKAYAVKKNFEIAWCAFPYPFYRFQQSLYALTATIYALRRRASFVYTRSEWLAIMLSKVGVSITIELHDYNPNLPLRLLMKEAQRGRLLAVVCISQALAEKLVDFGFPGEAIVVAHDAVDPERFEPALGKDAARKILNLPLDPPIACYVGNLRYDRRGMETLLSGAATLSHVWFLVVGGESEDVAEYQAIANRRHLKNISFVGHVSNSATPAYLFAADVLLMPYTTDTPHHGWFSPMKMFEYLAAGRPIISSDFPVLHEVLVEDQNVLFVEPANADALVQAILRLLGDESLALKLSKQGIQTAAQYTWRMRQEKILAFMHGRLKVINVRQPT